MGLMVTAPIGPTGDVGDIVITTLVANPGQESLAIYVGDDVGLYRSTEIFNAWGWLENGIKDRNIVQDFAPGFIFSGAPIDALTIPNRVTSGTLATAVTDDSVGLGMGNLLRVEDTWAHSWGVPYESAFGKLKDAALEYLKVNG